MNEPAPEEGTGRALRRIGDLAAAVDELLQPPTPYEPPLALTRSGEEICREALSLNLLSSAEIEGLCNDHLILQGLRVAFSRRFRDVLAAPRLAADEAAQALSWAEEALRFVKGLTL